VEGVLLDLGVGASVGISVAVSEVVIVAASEEGECLMMTIWSRFLLLVLPCSRRWT
jgi:hypothetical protein